MNPWIFPLVGCGAPQRLCITLRLDHSLTFRKAQNLLSILEYSSPGDVHEESTTNPRIFSTRGLWVFRRNLLSICQ